LNHEQGILNFEVMQHPASIYSLLIIQYSLKNPPQAFFNAFGIVFALQMRLRIFTTQTKIKS